jgi:hypothetical protein
MHPYNATRFPVMADRIEKFCSIGKKLDKEYAGDGMG